MALSSPPVISIDDQTKVTAVINRKGGVGKSTVTVNLAAAIAVTIGMDPGPKIISPVCVISIDPQGSALWWSKRVEAARLPFDFVDASADVTLVQELLAEGYRQIFIDTPGWTPNKKSFDGMGESEEANNLRAVLGIADDVLIPIEPEGLAYEPTEFTIERTLAAHPRPYSVVINNWEPRDGTVDLDDLKAWLAKRPGWPVNRTVIRRYRLHTRAAIEGKVCTEYPSNTTGLKAKHDFFQLALELSMKRGS